MSDWDAWDDEKASKKQPPPVSTKTKKRDSEGNEQVESDWDQSSDDDSKPTTTTTTGPQKKKGSLKAKLTEKEAARKARLESGELEEEYMDMREKYMDEKEMRRIMREKELEADMGNASDLFGNMAIADKSKASSAPTTKASSGNANIPAHLAPFLNLPPPSRITTKADFDALSKLIYTHLLKPASAAAPSQYAAFVETHAKLISSNLKDSEVRKVANTLGALANQKAAEAKAKASSAAGVVVGPGKKNLKGLNTGGGMLAGEGGGKGRYDMTAYDEVLDDFDDDEFM